jgi:hypothetical protein
MAAMNEIEVNAAEGAIYSLSAAGLVVLIVAAFFVWRSLQSAPADGADPSEAHHKAAE